MKLQVVLLIASLTVVAHISPAEADCCYRVVDNHGGSTDPKYWFNLKCCDGTQPTPWCGYGECNIFGCNCDGGCRTGYLCSGKKKRSVQEEASLALADFDADSDGKVSLYEVRSTIAGNPGHHLGRLSDAELERSFVDMDLNNDGFISLHEMDSSA